VFRNRTEAFCPSRRREGLCDRAHVCGSRIRLLGAANAHHHPPEAYTARAAFYASGRVNDVVRHLYTGQLNCIVRSEYPSPSVWLDNGAVSCLSQTFLVKREIANSQKPISISSHSARARRIRGRVGRIRPRTVQSRSKGVVTRVFKDGYAYVQDSQYPRLFVVTFKELVPSAGRAQQFRSIRDGARVEFTEKRGQISSFELIS
jgi:hypothetical protein